MAKWFSAALDAIQSLQSKGTPEQMVSQLRKQPGVRKEELDLLDLESLFDGKDVITVEDLQKKVRARLYNTGLLETEHTGIFDHLNQPTLNVREYSGRRNEALNQYLDRSLFGNKDYSSGYEERVPFAGYSEDTLDYKMAENHYNNPDPDDFPLATLNVGHTRGGRGEAMLNDSQQFDDAFILDEVQSDLHQSIARQLRDIRKNAGSLTDSEIAKATENRRNLPFQKSWPELLLKDALQEAVRRDAKVFGFVDGDTQKRRYWSESMQDHYEPQALARFYDDRLVNSRLWKQLGLDKPIQGHGRAPGSYGGHARIYGTRLTDEFKDRVLQKGLPLFSLGALGVYGLYQDEGALYE